MACFPIRRYRPANNSFDHLVGDQLDFFDPWYDLEKFSSDEQVKSNTFRWIHQPQRSTNTLSIPTNDDKPRQPTRQPTNSKKFRLQLNITGYDPQTISSRIDGQRVIIEGKQEDRSDVDNARAQPLHQVYDLPDYADLDHLTAYITPNSLLVIEVPICHPRSQRRPSLVMNDEQNVLLFGQYRDPLFDYVGFLGGSNIQSRIVDKGNSQKQLEMSVGMNNFRPEEIKVSVKNNELIVQGEHVHKDKNRSERSFFFKSTMLPPGTQVDQLQSRIDEHGQLKIEAPFVEPKQDQHSIENKK